MNDNEKLIEEAAIKIDNDAWLRADDFRSVFGRPFGLTEQQDRKDAARAKARAVLAVFEKAHTPTDDEREAPSLCTSAYCNPRDDRHVSSCPNRPKAQDEPSDAQVLERVEQFAQSEGVMFADGPRGAWLPADALLDILGERSR